MKCAQCQSLIDDIGDMDRLPSDAARHVAACTACERFGVELIGLRRLLREPARVAAPESFDTDLARRLRASKAASPSRLALLWALRPQTSLAAAAAFLLVCSGALVVSRYAMSPEAGSEPNMVVATNRPPATAQEPQSERLPEPNGVAAGQTGSVLPNVASVSYDGTRASRAAGRSRMTNRRLDSGDAMLLVSDDQGSRLVDVPSVLVGSEMIVPDAAGAMGESSDTVAF